MCRYLSSFGLCAPFCQGDEALCTFAVSRTYRGERKAAEHPVEWPPIGTSAISMRLLPGISKSRSVIRAAAKGRPFANNTSSS